LKDKVTISRIFVSAQKFAGQFFSYNFRQNSCKT
jgi:hypothetical protein